MNMKHLTAMAATLALFAGAVDAKPLKLKLANPQPSSVSAGLAVDYAYPKDVKSLRDAYVALGVKSETGTPLVGLDYLSSDDEPMALTSKKETKVAARIKGYIRFDAPGTYTLETYSNDGLDLSIGGQQIAKVDAKRPCDPIGEVEVSIKTAGWYEVEALYWQRKGGSCLILEWSQNGAELDVVPTELYGH
ncbi:PA14 domain-containing protein [Amylibacter sp. IMCC11727]|mgnify:CR=1 FL=1|uniref:PA14 domain-containing protein n=1 Tax=Amylibacter sp. IMCC11727 TaxID=3039851 RepID=UPI00244E077A|nr:PA14 domain-containing protein [Amylibacter sp. IMCC11727]WGI20598.1 PA14 domain-containing protein [Amylibacter sp. IMCC11727]